MSENLSKSLKETYEIAQNFIDSIFPNQEKAFIAGLYGDLGSGKTTFVKGIAKNLGMKERVTSPTFIIQKTFHLQPTTHNKNFKTLIHIDAYRLEGSEEIEKLGWNEIIKNPKNLILVEWPEKIAKVMPSDHLKINFKFIDENTREITFDKTNG